MVNAGAAPADPENPYAPAGPGPIVFDNFLGIDTSAPRSGIPDEAMAWCDGFMPVERGNARTLPDVGNAIYTAPAGRTIVYYDFANIGSTAYCVVFLDDGSIVGVSTGIGNPATTIAPAGTIVRPNLGNMGISQWGSQYILIVTNQSQGYFIWDGNALYQAGTIAPLVVVTNSGLNYSSQPTITAAGGSGSGATFSATISGGAVDTVTAITPGNGYQIGDDVVLSFSGGGSDTTAQATATISADGGISSVAVTNGGGGYSSLSYVVPSPRKGGANLALQAASGTIIGIQVINPGSGYTTPPSISIFDPNSTGTGATFTAYLANGQISSISVTKGGTGYRTPPSVSIIGDGTGASANASISGGSVTSIDVIDAGLGYTKAVVQFSGGNNAAEATVDIMPFGVRGTAIETYQSRAWITNGALLQFTAPESLADFATSDGGGAVESVDSFLKVAYTRPIQTNGFLYLIADSSINYISGVQTTGVPPTTTYTNQNADPEIGTPWAPSINVFSRNIIFGNVFGIHVSYGGAVTKVSEALDGIYGTSPRRNSFTPSSGKAIIFGKKVWMILLPVIDPISGQDVNKLFMWNGKNWWSSSQSVALTFIASVEVNSNLTTYGTDGNAIYPLFQTPSAQFTKTIQSKLWNAPGGYEYTKSASRLWGMAYYRRLAGGALNVSIDCERDTDSTSVVIAAPSTTGDYILPPTAIAQQGALTGLTLSTNAADMQLVSLKISDQIQDYRG